VAVQKLADPDTERFCGRVAARLRAMRVSLGLSQQQFAARLFKLHGVGQSLSAKLQISVNALPADEHKILVRVRHYESGRAALPLDLFPAWAKALGVPIRELLPTN
jgi:transcriptional regulator with XRE-family HTH domain